MSSCYPAAISRALSADSVIGGIIAKRYGVSTHVLIAAVIDV